MWFSRLFRKTPMTPPPAPLAPAAPQQPFEHEYQQLARVRKYRSELDENSSDESIEREILAELNLPKHWIPMQSIGPKPEAPFIPPTPPACMKGNTSALAAWHDFHSSLSGCSENPMRRYGPMKPATPPPVLTMGDVARYRRDRELAGYVTLESDPEPREISHPWKPSTH